MFCYEPYDELVLMQLQAFLGKNIISVEKEMRLDKESDNLANLGEGSLLRSQIDEIIPWIKKTLASKVNNVKVSC